MFEKWRTLHGPGTHVLMDGGILDVPLADTNAFYIEYISAVRRGRKVYVVEQKTDVFRFFVDLDYKGPEAITDELLLEVLQKMCDVVPGRCVVARAPVREVDGLQKSGVHIHWPDTFVTRQEALAHRTKILMELDGPEWSEFIDASVYGGSGLRMLWSHKKPTGEPYVPWTPEGFSTDGPDIETLALFSGRTNEERPTVDDTGSHEGLEEYIRKYIPGQERARVKRIGQKGQTRWVQTDSRFCENIGQEHKSNHVWFSIYGDKICQMCHDADTCQGFVGREYLLSPSIVDDSVAAPVRLPISSLLPDHWFLEANSQPVHQGSTSVLGSRPGHMERVQRKNPSVRGGKGHSRGGKTSVSRYREHP